MPIVVAFNGRQSYWKYYNCMVSQICWANLLYHETRFDYLSNATYHLWFWAFVSGEQLLKVENISLKTQIQNEIVHHCTVQQRQHPSSVLRPISTDFPLQYPFIATTMFAGGSIATPYTTQIIVIPNQPCSINVNTSRPNLCSHQDRHNPAYISQCSYVPFTLRQQLS